MNTPLNGYTKESYKTIQSINFMIHNLENIKVRRADIVLWVYSSWEEVKVETITITGKSKFGIILQDVAIVK